jgi:cytochrome P450
MTTLSAAAYPPGPTNPRETLLAFARNPLAAMLDLHKNYGDFVHYRLGPAHVYLVSRPALIRQVLVEMNDVMERTKLTHDTLGKFIGQGLIISAGDFHKKQRRTIQPAFTPTWMASYSDSIVHSTLELIEAWELGSVRDLTEDMTTLTMQIVYRAIFGDDTSSADKEAQDAITVVQQYSGEALIRKPTITEDVVQQAQHALNHAVDELISRRNRRRKRDLLSLLLDSRDPETGEPMSPGQVRAEALNFFIAGQETSANALAWIWWLLALNPNSETTLHHELDTILSGTLPELKHLATLSYTEKVIKESMRLMPPVWLIGRRPTQTITLNGYAIDPDASIAISPYVLHRAYFDDPEHFRPERFEQEPARYTYLPFGAGPHVCIGQPFGMMEISLILATIAARWKLHLVPNQNIVPDPLITLRPKYGIRVTLEARTN